MLIGTLIRLGLQLLQPTFEGDCFVILSSLVATPFSVKLFSKILLIIVDGFLNGFTVLVTKSYL